MHVVKLAAFSDGETGGNPAGVVVAPELPSADEMQRIAAEVGFSETAFAAPIPPIPPISPIPPIPPIPGTETASGSLYRVRYFSPASEVPFCGHATIALGAVLAREKGDGLFQLQLNDAAITVEGRREGRLYLAALQSPPTRSVVAPRELAREFLDLFGYKEEELDPRLPPAVAHAGANHFVIGLATRKALARMKYDLEAGRLLMNLEGVVTVVLAWAETPQLFHTRNPFASGGVYEDPATGAGTAALAGYLRDLGWPHGNRLDVVQGEDMGMRSRLTAELTDVPGSSIRVSGTARELAPPPRRSPGGQE
jgi:PhzF family phenazine biosynthesis protein